MIAGRTSRPRPLCVPRRRRSPAAPLAEPISPSLSAVAAAAAAAAGHNECRAAPADAAADRAAAAQNDKTPLMYAAQFGRLEVVQHLIQRGADIRAKTATAVRPRRTRCGRRRMLPTKHRRCVRTLFCHPRSRSAASAGALYHWQKTALMYAAGNGHKEIVRLLLESKKGAELDSKTVVRTGDAAQAKRPD